MRNFFLRIRHISIRSKFMVFFVFIAVVLFSSVGFIFLRSTQTAVNISKEEQLLTLSQETANKVERFMFERYGDIQVMAQSPLIKNSKISSSFKQEYLDSVRKTYKTYDLIFTTDQTGNIDIVSGKMTNDVNYRDWLPEVLKGSIYISDFTYSTVDKSYKVYFAAPILTPDGKITGTVVERMSFESITQIVKNVRPGSSGYAYLLEKGGSSIFYARKEMAELSSNLLPQRSGVYYGGKGDRKYIAAYSPIKSLNVKSKDWYLVIEEPTKEAFEVTNKLSEYTVAVIFIALMISLALAVIISIQITGPIRRLVQETQTIAEGDISQKLEVESGDEVGSLANSFNTLLFNLKSMMQQVLEISGQAASLTEIRQYTDKFFNEVPTAIITVDSSGKVTTFNNNAVDITGTSKQEAESKTIGELAGGRLAEIENLVKDGIEEGKIYIKHIMNLKNDEGKEIPLMVNTSLHKDNSGKLLGVIIVFRKLEELKEFEESVSRANNLASLGALSAGMAHEIRNPLTSIKGYAQYVKSELGEAHELSTDISIIINEVDRLNNIIDRFLTFARPKQPELQEVNLNIVVENVLKLIKNDVLPANVKLKTSLVGIPSVMLDTEQLEQVVLNMILNSIQAMPEGGIIEISTRYVERSGLVALQIRDTGMGIRPEDYDKIFEPFFTTKNKGTGLGLAICMRIIENHKGFIEVSSTPDMGTSFLIKLPV